MFSLCVPPTPCTTNPSGMMPAATDGVEGSMLNVVVANQHPGVAHLQDGEESKVDLTAPSPTSNTAVNDGSVSSGRSSSALVLRDTSEFVDRNGRVERDSSEHSITSVPNFGGPCGPFTDSEWMRHAENTTAAMMNYQMPSKDMSNVLIETQRELDAFGKNAAEKSMFPNQLAEFWSTENDKNFTRADVAEELFPGDALTIMFDVEAYLRQSKIGGKESDSAMRKANAGATPEPNCCGAHTKNEKQKPSSGGQRTGAAVVTSSAVTGAPVKTGETPMNSSEQPDEREKLFSAGQIMDVTDNHSNLSGDSGENGGKTSEVSANSAGFGSAVSKNSLRSSQNSKISSMRPTENSAVSMTSSIKESDKNGSDSECSLGSRVKGQAASGSRDQAKALLDQIYVKLELEVDCTLIAPLESEGVAKAMAKEQVLHVDESERIIDELDGARKSGGRHFSEKRMELDTHKNKSRSTNSSVEVQLQEPLLA